MKIEDQLRAVLAAGWRPPATQVSAVDDLEALPAGTVVTDSDGQTWVRNRVGEWCEPYPAGIDPDELLADGPVTVQCLPLPDSLGIHRDSAVLRRRVIQEGREKIGPAVRDDTADRGTGRVGSHLGLCNLD